MRPLVATNIEQSFDTLDNRVSEFPRDFVTFAAADISYERPFSLHGPLTLSPVLYIDHAGVVLCAQESYFGFFVLQQALRCLLLGVNYQVAGDVLFERELYGPAVATYYTSAYHTLHAFLALEGRVLFDCPIWPIPSRSPSPDRRQPYIALLTARNSWVFERRARSHRRKWLEVQQAFTSSPDDLPGCFHSLFDYMYRGVFQRGVDLLDRIENPGRYQVRLADRFEEFLIRIAETRHTSIYGSFGSDPNVVEALWNGDVFSRRGIDNQAGQFGKFAGSLMVCVSSDVHSIIGRVNPNPEVRTALMLSIHMPWFDDPQIGAMSIPKIADTVNEIIAWIDQPIESPVTAGTANAP
jgi:hypothetical protein